MSIRRNIRLRREYLYRKSVENKERTIFDKKRKIRAALQAGKSIPTELRADEIKLRREMEAEDAATAVQKTHQDDEYGKAGLEDPKICITTSRDPSSKLREFTKELRLIFPTSHRINRGNTKISELVDTCRRSAFTDIIIVQEHRGVPVGLVVSHLPYGPTAQFAIANPVLRHDLPEKHTISEAYPHLIFDNFETKLGLRFQSILKYLFPVPKPDSKRVMSFINQRDYISFRHHTYRKNVENGEVTLEEVGPRFELRPFQITLGTIEQTDAEIEWVLRPYMNTAKKRQVL